MEDAPAGSWTQCSVPGVWLPTQTSGQVCCASIKYGTGGPFSVKVRLGIPKNDWTQRSLTVANVREATASYRAYIRAESLPTIEAAGKDWSSLPDHERYYVGCVINLTINLYGLLPDNSSSDMFDDHASETLQEKNLLRSVFVIWAAVSE